MRFFLILALQLFSLKVFAYPDFISVGYRTCITCHYNGQGGGALNDYGRAVWASELTSRVFTGNKTPDELGESSGFLGKTEMPWWIRPGFKYRGLWVKTNVGSSESVTRWINMQAEANVAVHFDKRYEKVFVGSFGYTPIPQRFSTSNDTKPSNWTSHEYYFRWQQSKQSWLYIGFMDKFYGIKHPDHTAFSRALLRNSFNDQTHGIAYQRLTDEYDFVGHLFLGNMLQDKDLRQYGASGIYEKMINKSLTFGVTFMSLHNDYLMQNNTALITRHSFAKNDSLFAEVGLKEDKNKTANSIAVGYYVYMQVLKNVAQGYNFLSTMQLYKTELNSGSPVANRISIGGMFFPYPKTEVRMELINNRTEVPEIAGPDQWNFQSQVHLAL